MSGVNWTTPRILKVYEMNKQKINTNYYYAVKQKQNRDWLSLVRIFTWVKGLLKSENTFIFSQIFMTEISTDKVNGDN